MEQFRESMLVIWFILMALPLITALVCAVMVVKKYNEVNARQFFSESNTLLLGALYPLLLTITLLAALDLLNEATIGLLGTLAGYVLGNLRSGAELAAMD